MTSEKLFSMASFRPNWGPTDVCQRPENRPGLIFRPHAVLTPQCGNRQRVSSWTRGVEAASEHAHQLVLEQFAALPWDKESFLTWTQFYNWIINRHQGLIKQQFHCPTQIYPKHWLQFDASARNWSIFYGPLQNRFHMKGHMAYIPDCTWTVTVAFWLDFEPLPIKEIKTWQGFELLLSYISHIWILIHW